MNLKNNNCILLLYYNSINKGVNTINFLNIKSTNSELNMDINNSLIISKTEWFLYREQKKHTNVYTFYDDMTIF